MVDCPSIRIDGPTEARTRLPHCRRTLSAVRRSESTDPLKLFCLRGERELDQRCPSIRIDAPLKLFDERRVLEFVEAVRQSESAAPLKPQRDCAFRVARQCCPSIRVDGPIEADYMRRRRDPSHLCSSIRIDGPIEGRPTASPRCRFPACPSIIEVRRSWPRSRGCASCPAIRIDGPIEVAVQTKWR